MKPSLGWIRRCNLNRWKPPSLRHDVTWQRAICSKHWVFDCSFGSCPWSFQLWLYALETALDAKHSDAVLALARQALQRFGETPRLLQHLTPIKMLQRQPGLARRTALLQQVWSTTWRLCSSRQGNQLNTYEHNGDAYWLEYLKPSVLEKSSYSPAGIQQLYATAGEY